MYFFIWYAFFMEPKNNLESLIRQQSQTIAELFTVIPEVHQFLLPDSRLFSFFDSLIKNYYQNLKAVEKIDIGPIKDLSWPMIPLGNLNSYDLFSLAKFLHFIYLHKNIGRYKTIFDIGGNVGLDSIVFEKSGYNVYAFEPDPLMVKIFEKNVQLNNCKNITLVKKALSDKKETNKFVRVKGNLTASHIDGARGYYGDVDFLTVESITFDDIDITPDIMKINIEGFEKQLVPAIPPRILDSCDLIISIHEGDSRGTIYDFLTKHGMNIFSQKTGWNLVHCEDELPGVNKEGYIFATKNKAMHW